MSLERVAAQKRKQLWHRRWCGLCAVFCVLAVLVTAHALILPARTDETAVYCGLDEHSHGDKCLQTEYLCGLLETEDGHLHSEECTVTEQVLLCTLPEQDGHLHNANCYAQQQELCCDLEEGEEHTHNEACYTPSTELLCALPESEGHTHKYSCYESRTTYVCGLVEGHLHSDTCYQELQVSCCILAENEEHTHEASCFTTVKELICELEGAHIHTEACVQSVVVCALAEHTHGLACYANPSADLETAEQWERTLPPLTGNKLQDLRNIARSQLGYQESDHNYIVSDDGVTKGYSRYGQWYGDAYGDWCAMFAAFCLRHAGFAEVPVHSNCQRWVEDLSEAGLYMPAGVYVPRSGDVIFFDLDGDNTADHVGLVSEVNENILTIEGNAADAVRARQYSREDGTVMGYAVLSQLEAAPPKRGLEGNYQEVGTTSNFTTHVNNNTTTHIRLTADMTISTNYTIPSNKDLTIDLNGHTLTYSNTSNAMFTVGSGETLTIWDSQQPMETVTMAQYDPENRIEYPATLSGKTLTYYVMTTQVVDPALGATQEAVQQHTITATGGIQAAIKSTSTSSTIEKLALIYITGGTFNLEGGMLYGVDYDGKLYENRAISMTNGTANLNGGYICGFDRNFSGTLDATKQFGGAVYMTGGTVNVMGSVLAANTAGSAGAIYASAGTVNIGGTDERVAIIAGNQAKSARDAGSGKGYNGGGGVYLRNDAKLYMTAGYVTNNIVVNYTDSAGDDNPYGGDYSGGGGVFLEINCQMDFCGGYITGNWADGGGGIRTSLGGTNYLTMYCLTDEDGNVISAPYVNGNVARCAEGGGIHLGSASSGSISGASILGGYINNNKINQTPHWGGGGVFCYDGATLHIEDALITENTAGGLGGGMAGCATGHLFLYMEHGCAIYGNYDKVYGDIQAADSLKSDDWIWEDYPQTLNHGHCDYFCALESVVQGGMLGGGAAKWEGSADGIPVTVEGDESVSAEHVMALQSHATEEDKRAAEREAKLYINGNHSYTHGGGILVNGVLSVGSVEPMFVPIQFKPDSTKKLVDSEGNEIPMDSYQFHFAVIDHLGNEISSGVTDSTGHIVFDRFLVLDEVGTATFYIKELREEAYSNIQTDTALYRLTTTVQEKEPPKNTDTNATKIEQAITNAGIDRKYLQLTGFVLDKQNAQGEWETVYSKTSLTHIGTIELSVFGDSPIFTNVQMDYTDIQVQKVWKDNSNGAVTVRLYRDETLLDTQVLNSQNSWSHTWADMPVGDGTRKYEYRVEEDAVAGYVTEYFSTFSSGNTYWVPATSLSLGKEYLITNSSGDYAMMLTSGNANATLTTSDRVAVSRKSGTLTLGSGTYTTWYEGDMASDRVFVAVSTDNASYLTLKNKAMDSWLATTKSSSWWNTSYYLQGRTTKSNCSAFFLNSGRLQGTSGNSYTGSDRYTVIYSGNKFGAANSTTNAAQVYEKVTLPGGLLFTIVNTPVESTKYEINLEKVSGKDGSALVGAKFQLLDTNGAALSFTTKGDGIYTYSTASGATTEPVTSTGGRMVLTGLPAGQYTLRETEAPVGHKPIEDYTLHLGEGAQGTTISLRLVDPEDIYTLPETGGEGTTLYIVVGLILCLTGGILFYGKRRREAVEDF